MPVKVKKEGNKCWVQWGEKGNKYYYPCNNENKKNEAKQKAYNQGLAIGKEYLK